MQEIIKEIRKQAQLSQNEFAEALRVSFSTVNRWENGKVIPNQLAQMSIYEYAQSKGIAVDAMVYEKIRNAQAALALQPDRMLLYHGSKSGIKCTIAPVSREHCDFGSGFYMGTIPEQPLTLISSFEQSRFYLLSVDMTGMSTLQIPPDIDWAMLVAFHRGRMESIKGSSFYRKYAEMTENKDFLIGSIADDRMFFVLDNFFQGNITDTALISSLSALKLGEQVVAVTQKACDAIRIEKEIPLSFLEKKALQDASEQNRVKGIALADEICKKHRREGLFFDEILEKASEESK